MGQPSKFCVSVLAWLLCTFADAQDQHWVLENVQVVDVEIGVLLPGVQDLYISNGRIFEMAPSGNLRSYQVSKKVDAGGKFLIPGMWDMHAHPDDPELWRMDIKEKHRDLLLPQFVLHGVTGIRDMAGSLAEVHRWRKLGHLGELIVPKIVACGPLLDGPDPMWDGSLGINNSSRVIPIVDSLMLAGADFLKVYSLLPREIYFSLAEYATETNIPMVGHVPIEVLPTEAARSGMKSQEHLLEILLECSGRSEDISSGNVDYGDLETGLERHIYKQNLIIDTFDSTKFQHLIETLLETDSYITPTLSMWYKNAWYEQELEHDSILLNFLPTYLRKYWTIEINDHLRNRDHLDFINMKKKLYSKYENLVKTLQQAGVKILAGTDMGANPLCFPGIGVLNELEALTNAGLSPAEALRTATFNPALFLEIDSDYGSVESGKVADLVLLKANPLEDINHVRSIWGVILEGELYDFQERSKNLEAIRAALKN